ncbi:MAG: TonB-dependent receptor [Saprospiraceae bacterium]
MKFILSLFFSIFLNVIVSAQSDSVDINTIHILEPIDVKANRIIEDIERLEPIKETYIFSGKKSEVIELTQKNLAVSEKYGRQIFAKIPGIFVYDMDGTGNQVNVSTRGLDAHRGWEFNIRKDGILTNSDMYGYPASHYNIPMEAVERIELVRGTGSLQFGAQFGGLLNYISKKPDTTKEVSFEAINTIGSYGLVSTYNCISGKIGKFRYSAYANKKWITGYRDNSESNYDAESISLYYDASSKLHVKLDWSRSNYLIQLAGQLNDSMFNANPKQSTRSRNYYNPEINVPSLTIDWNLKPRLYAQFKSSAVIGVRNSILFDKPATTPDDILPTTLQYRNRQVDIDHFNSYTNELRFLYSYRILKKEAAVSFGIQHMNNNLHRQQLGVGSTGTDFNLDLVSPGWGRDLHYKTNNIALFFENNWKINNRLSVNEGARLEMGETNLNGLITYYADSAIPNTIKHKFPLLGINFQYDLRHGSNIYGGFSQAYRPVIFKDIIPASIYEISDKNLKDAKGHNLELGIRGNWKWFKWDLSAFSLQYNNRLGTIAQSDSAGNLIIFRTNIGDSRTNGLEIFLQGDYYISKSLSFSVFTSTSIMDARYQNASIRSGSNNINVDGNQVESVPKYISRNGFTLTYHNFSFSTLYSYTSESFADALNSKTPNSTGASGLVPSYQIVDFNLALKISSKLKLQFNINNALNASYFTKRPQFYPGPGIWPSDGRSFSGTFSIKI